MVDTSLMGMRCRATKEISSHEGLSEDTARASFSTTSITWGGIS
jgi:hypothetical protein